MKTFDVALACCIALGALALSPADAKPRKLANAQVTVSKPAASLPGRAYAWVPMPTRIDAESHPRAQDPQRRAQLQAALDKALQAKGYRRVDNLRQADIAVAYRVGARDLTQTKVRETGPTSAAETAMECRSDGCSQIVTMGADHAPALKVDSIDTLEGGLLVEVIKPSDIRVLWRAMYRGSILAKHAGSTDLDDIATRTLAALPRAPSK